MQQIGGHTANNEIAFACKLKIDKIHPSDFIESNRSQRKIQEIELNLLKNCLSKFTNFSNLYRNHKFSDIVLIVKDIEYRSHKTVLA